MAFLPVIDTLVFDSSWMLEQERNGDTLKLGKVLLPLADPTV
jgi:hypothetical protein